MFLLQSPTIRETASTTALPDRFRARACARHGRTPIAAAQPIESFLEGPVCDGDGNLYVTDIPFGRIFRITPSLEWQLVAEYDGEPNGMKRLDPRALRRDRLSQRPDARAHCNRSRSSPLLERRNTERFKGVNDLVFDSRGNLYFTDQGQTGMHDPTGRVYRLRPNGKLDTLIANAPSPNGIVLSPDEQFLYVAMTRGNCVWRMPLFPDGSIGKAGQFFTSYGPSGPDGLAMDEVGAPHRVQSGAGLGVGAERTCRTCGNPAQRGGQLR